MRHEIVMSDPTKRICPFCAETIEVKAKLCPHCRQWLTWKSFRHPLVMVWTHLVPTLGVWALGAVAMFSILDRIQNPKPYYSEFPDSLRIIESQMHWVQTQDGLRIFITGVITNSSPVHWKDTEFDCRFFAANGDMVDAGTGRGFMNILPKDDAAFRVSIVPTAPTNNYASFKISIDNAINAESWY